MLTRALVSGSPVSSWCSLAHPMAERRDAWAHALSEFFLPWSIDACDSSDVKARVRQCALDDCRFIQCASSAVSGSRRGLEIGRTRGDYYNLLYVVSGSELLKFQGREVPLSAGQFVLWDSSRSMEFLVRERLEKLTLVVPERQMRSLLPNAQDYVGVALDGNHGMARLFANHLRSLRREIWRMQARDLSHVRSPTLDLLAKAYAFAPCRKRPSQRAETLRRVRAYILAHLPEPDLGPQRIAADNRISVRYLHLLFRDIDSSVAAWIRAQRLERCVQDLSNPALTHQSITQIAYRWGFNDLGHFSKLIRREFGVAPRALRRQRLNQTPAQPRVA